MTGERAVAGQGVRASRGIRGLAWLFTHVPLLGRLWARHARVTVDAGVPWAPLGRPLRQCRAALVTTAGVHLRTDVPFDMTNPLGDPTFRMVPAGTEAADLTITHDYYDHRDADRDLNIVFPLERFRELVGAGILGGLSPEHWSFMGHIDGPLVRTLTTDIVPRLVGRLRELRPDFVFLTPA